MTSGPPVEALEAFASHLPRDGHVLLCGEPDSPVTQWFSARGLLLQQIERDKDLRLLTLKRESIDGIWAFEKALQGISIEDAQRVIASFFQALRPKTGVLFVSHPYPQTAFQSLLRQNGFRLVLQGSRDGLNALVAVRT